MTAALRSRVVILVLVLPLLFAACGQTIGDTIDDATITTRVKSALLNDPEVGTLRIDVNTNAGIVTLSGSVRSKQEIDRAVALTRKVQGVKDVKSTLRVSDAQTGSARAQLPVPAAIR